MQIIRPAEKDNSFLFGGISVINIQGTSCKKTALKKSQTCGEVSDETKSDHILFDCAYALREQYGNRVLYE